MKVVVTITVIDDDGTALDAVAAVEETVDEALETARRRLDVTP